MTSQTSTTQTQSESAVETDSLSLDRQMLAILDFGSQYSELIARRVRETEVYSEVLSYRTTAEQLRKLNPKGIILSGGPSSVYDEGAPACDPEIWNLGIPVMGVCYGMQLMVKQLGGQVERAERRPAVKALVSDRKSLLPVGVKAVQGSFRRGDMVVCVAPDGREVARGLVNYSALEAQKIIGRPSDEIERLLGYVDEPELVHRDNLILVQ